MGDSLHEECGVFGISIDKSSNDVLHKMYLGLFSLQHRGQESCGVAYKEEDGITVIKEKGLVAGNFFEQLPDNGETQIAIGHVRYSTTGASNLINAQPLLFNCNKGEIAISHNGNIPNSTKIKEELIQLGSIFQTSSDSEILVHLLSRIPGNDFEKALISALNHLSGAYSMLILHEGTLIAFRDTHGFRPLSYGKIDGGYVFASESNALDILDATEVTEIEPGEIVFCKNGEIRKKRFSEVAKPSQCVFELIYFSRPDSTVFNEPVHEFRMKAGQKLARKSKHKADIAISVPDSGNSAALGFSREMDIPFEFGLIRNHYTGRSFIKPGQSKREESVKIKLNPVPSIINGKKIAVIDDSLVRGTTSSKIVKMLKDAGAKEVHMYLSSPEIIASCYFGIDTPTKKELISSSHSPEQIAKKIGADSVTFLSIDDLKSCVKKPDSFCYACYTGSYPLPVEEK